MTEEFNMSMRKFLKQVGVTSQQAIEEGLREKGRHRRAGIRGEGGADRRGAGCRACRDRHDQGAGLTWH